MVIENDIKRAIDNFKSAVIRYPNAKIMKSPDSTERMDNFCIFILTFGRPNNVRTLKTLLKDGAEMNQDYYLVCSDDDKYLDEYIEKYGDRVLVFSKNKMKPYLDRGDNWEKDNVILYARNICWTFAKLLNYKYFVELDDDYSQFTQRIFYNNSTLIKRNIKNHDEYIKIYLDFLKNTPTKTVTLAQHGDMIGGAFNNDLKRGWKRKVMNSFFCDLDDPFLFFGSINEDVNAYTTLGRIGNLNFNLYGFSLTQESTQQKKGGMTESYLDGGTYLKTFYSILYCPSAVKVGSIGIGKNKRIHHVITGNYCYPRILDEKYSKETYNKIHETF